MKTKNPLIRNSNVRSSRSLQIFDRQRKINKHTIIRKGLTSAKYSNLNLNSYFINLFYCYSVRQS